MQNKYFDTLVRFFEFLGYKDKTKEIISLIEVYEYNGIFGNNIKNLMSDFENELRGNLVTIEGKDDKVSYLVHVVRKLFRQGNFWFPMTPEKEVLKIYQNTWIDHKKELLKTFSAYEKYIIITESVYKYTGNLIKMICNDFGIESYSVFLKAEMARDFFSTDEITEANQRVYEKSLIQSQNDNNGTATQQEKIKWLGTPSQFGFIFMELIRQGYIQPPNKNSESSYKALAGKCYRAFDIAGTLKTLEKELSEKTCSLSEVKRGKFTIPHISELK